MNLNLSFLWGEFQILVWLKMCLKSFQCYCLVCFFKRLRLLIFVCSENFVGAHNVWDRQFCPTCLRLGCKGHFYNTHHSSLVLSLFLGWLILFTFISGAIKYPYFLSSLMTRLFSEWWNNPIFLVLKTS